MPRIRSLKPEIVSDVKLGRVSRDARLTFIYAITQADDIGLLAGAHRQLLGSLYPIDDDVTVPALLGWIEELVEHNLVRWRATRDGIPVLQLVNWQKHQRVDNAGRSQLGALLAESPDDLALESDGRGDSPQVAATRGGSPLGSPITDHRPRTTDQGPPTTDAETARQFAAAANRGLSEHGERPQPIPRIIGTNGTTHSATKKMLGRGVPAEFGCAALYELGKTHAAQRPVSSLNYFADAVIRAWDEHIAQSDAAAHVPNVNGTGRRRRKTANAGEASYNAGRAAFEESV